MNDKSPGIDKRAFDCPHCGAYSGQTWFDVLIDRLTTQSSNNSFIDAWHPEHKRKNIIERLLNYIHINDSSSEVKEVIIEIVSKYQSGSLFNSNLFRVMNDSRHLDVLKTRRNESTDELNNLYVCKCEACKDFSIWVDNSLVYPVRREGVPPLEDMPDDIKALFNEARSIVNISPKGAAALLRLCVQLLCKELGESGENINADIASLVSKGLDQKVQQALDIVRVVGNDSVHPGQIELDDDREMALNLFECVNLIVRRMISEPNEIDHLYSRLPENKLEGIKNRDSKER